MTEQKNYCRMQNGMACFKNKSYPKLLTIELVLLLYMHCVKCKKGSKEERYVKVFFDNLANFLPISPNQT
jgi:hypothetical protein